MNIPRWDAIRDAYATLRAEMNARADEDAVRVATNDLRLAVNEAMESMGYNLESMK